MNHQGQKFKEGNFCPEDYKGELSGWKQLMAQQWLIICAELW